MARYSRRWTQRTRPDPKPLWLVGTGAFAIAFAGATYVLSPDAPGKAEVRREWSKRTTDQHYSECSQARANNHEDIASWEPSYRDHMDGDGDGLACEPRF
ncbi:MAG: excalibur calcium-binding domain-containing protein [Caulobacteraceae bacterium]|nr:excalibur calcium-binding domain-containing protein [Caulobacteraceae bacterium]